MTRFKGISKTILNNLKWIGRDLSAVFIQHPRLPLNFCGFCIPNSRLHYFSGLTGPYHLCGLGFLQTLFLHRNLSVVFAQYIYHIAMAVRVSSQKLIVSVLLNFPMTLSCQQNKSSRFLQASLCQLYIFFLEHWTSLPCLESCIFLKFTVSLKVVLRLLPALPPSMSWTRNKNWVFL